jgi:hypothetical protein
MKFNSIEGNLMKRNDKSNRYIEFFYRTEAVSFKKAREDDSATKQLLASEIKDIRMLNDLPE